MRELIKQQLQKIQWADMSHYDPETNVYNIPRYSKPEYKLGKMYIVQLPDIIINNTSSVLATNWNRATAPKTKYLKIYISKMVGKMLYVDSVGFDYDIKQDLPNLWSGYLPADEITQMIAL